MKPIVKMIPLMILIVVLGLFFYFQLNEYFTFEMLNHHRRGLLKLTSQHYLLAVFWFMTVYIVMVAASIPGAVFMTLLGGFLFGTWLGTVFAVISATIGAAILFWAAFLGARDFFVKFTHRFMKKMEEGFKKDAFSYLMVLRLVPIFPFWAVNIVSALLGVPIKTFMITTFLGIIPGALVYASLGSGLGSILDRGEEPNLKVIFEPYILIPLLGLALLSLAPIIYKRIRMVKRSKE